MFNKPEKKVMFESFGEDVVPVDLNWASVPEKKDGENNLEDAQDSIRRRFSLGR